MLFHEIRRIEARMRVAQLRSAHLQIVQQRMLPRTGDVRIVGKIPRAVEEAVGIAALSGAIVDEMVQRVGSGGGDVRIA